MWISCVDHRVVITRVITCGVIRIRIGICICVGIRVCIRVSVSVRIRIGFNIITRTRLLDVGLSSSARHPECAHDQQCNSIYS